MFYLAAHAITDIKFNNNNNNKFFAMYNIKGLQKLNIKIVKLERDNKYTHKW